MADTMMGFMDPEQMAQLQGDIMQLQRNQSLAQSLMQNGQTYIPNSGKAGIFAGLANLLRGNMLQGQSDSKVSDILRRQFEMQNQASNAQRQQQLQDEQRKFAEELGLALGKATAEAKAKRDYASPEFKDGGVFDPTTGSYTPSSAWTQQQLALKKAEAGIAASNRAPPEIMARIQLAQQMGATPEQLRAMVLGGGGDSSAQWQVIGSNRVNKVTGEVQPLNGPDGKPIAVGGAGAKSVAAAEAAQKNLAKQVLNYVSTATGMPVEKLSAMSPDQVAGIFQQKGGRDWGTAIASQIPFVGPSITAKVNPNLEAFATAAQAQEARVQHPVGTIPYNAEILARKSSIGPEKTDAFNAQFIKSALEDAGIGTQATAPTSATPAYSPQDIMAELQRRQAGG